MSVRWGVLPFRIVLEDQGGVLERRLPGKRVFLENDVRAAALSEHRLGAGRG
jgi:predicted NBD/HSP70 family sugar kinase